MIEKVVRFFNHQKKPFRSETGEMGGKSYLKSHISDLRNWHPEYMQATRNSK